MKKKAVAKRRVNRSAGALVQKAVSDRTASEVRGGGKAKNADLPTESLSLNFTKIGLDYQK